MRVVGIANAAVMMIFVCIETSRRVFNDISLQGSYQAIPLQVWEILRGVTANVATMVNSVTCRFELYTNPPPCLTTTGYVSIGRDFRGNALSICFHDSCRGYNSHSDFETAVAFCRKPGRFHLVA